MPSHSERTTVCLPALSALLLTTALLANTAASDENGEVLIDGISVISGNRTSNESDATPVLLSDIEFDAVLVAASKRADSSRIDDFSDEEWREARRQAVLIRLLSAQARLLHETVKEADRKAIRDEIATLVGGDLALYRLLSRFGLDAQSIDIFTENTALALTQIRYFEEQVDLPTPPGRQGARSEKKRDRTNDSLAGRYRRLIRRKQADEQIRRWLTDLLDNSHIRIIR